MNKTMPTTAETRLTPGCHEPSAGLRSLTQPGSAPGAARRDAYSTAVTVTALLNADLLPAASTARIVRVTGPGASA